MANKNEAKKSNVKTTKKKNTSKKENIKNKETELKKVNKKRIIAISLIFLIVIILIICIVLSITNNNKIKNATLSWYNDQNKIYNKTTIGALYQNGYINSNKTLFIKKDISCQVIEIKDDKVVITNNNDCNLNEEMEKVPTIMLDLIKTNDNSKYDPNTWTSSDIKIELSYKNNNVKQSDINRIYLTKNYQENSNDNSLIISSDSNINDIYTVNLMLNDGSVYSKDFTLMIDKTKPELTDIKVTDNDYNAYFEDKESNISEILYYVSNTEYAPTKIEQFELKENIEINNDTTYYIWASAINNAGIHADFVKLGEFSKK